MDAERRLRALEQWSTVSEVAEKSNSFNAAEST